MDEEVLEKDCCVSEEIFPCLGKCFRKIDTISGVAYEKLCPSCRIWTSLPTGANLTVTSIFECEERGFGKRNA